MLTIVPTPLGNLKDITYRAIETLKNCDVVFCEDTRRTIQLLNHYGIIKKIIRYNEHNDKSLEEIASMLILGKNICLLSDGGMPVISDPGYRAVNEALKNNIKVEVLPGPSIVTSIMAGSGFSGPFSFLGFLPRGNSKIVKILSKYFDLNSPVIVFESPYRFKDFLKLVGENFPDCHIVAVREMTKVYEQWYRGKPSEIIDKLKDVEIKGELTLILSNFVKQELGEGNIKKILYVCSGNTCRSVMAHYYSKSIFPQSFSFSSSGICVGSTDISREAKEIFKKEKIEFDNHIPEQLNLNHLKNNDLVLCMTKRHKEILNGYFPEFKSKIYSLSEYVDLGYIDIKDPYGRGELEYLLAFKTIKNMVNLLFEKLKKV
jgi:16S rRNA (cytidine1402-2'-O)-methyltransferase